MKEKFFNHHFCILIIGLIIFSCPLNSLASIQIFFPSDHTTIVEPGENDIDMNNPEVQSVAISPDEKLLAAGGHDYTLRIWDFETCQLKSILQLKHSHQFTNIVSVAFSPDGSWLAVGGKDWAIYLWQTDSLFKNEVNFPHFRGHST